MKALWPCRRVCPLGEIYRFLSLALPPFVEFLRHNNLGNSSVFSNNNAGIYRTWHFLDPFIEAGFGAAGRVDLSSQQESLAPGYLYAGNYDYNDYNRLLNLSLIGYIAAGLSIRINMLYVSGKLSYWPLNTPPPATQYMPYPVKQFQFAISAGFVVGR